MSEVSERNKVRSNDGAEIEITPEIIRAGVSVLLGMDSRFEDERDVVERMFEKMISVANVTKQTF